MTEAVIKLQRFVREDVNRRVEQAKAIETGSIQLNSTQQRVMPEELMKSSVLSVMNKVVDESNTLIKSLEHELVACRNYVITGIALFFASVPLSFPYLALPGIGFIFLGMYHHYCTKKYAKQLLELIEYD